MQDLAPSTGRGLDALEQRVRTELELLKYPELPWVPPRQVDGKAVLDVLIVGAGQGGLAVASMLLQERVDNILVIDAAPRGREGPWRTYARMKTLRSWKTVTGPDLGFPSLTFQAWFEAQHGTAAFEALGKIAKEDWNDYLLWLRDTLALPVENGTRLQGIEPAGELLAATLEDGRGQRVVLARKLVLAMGIERSGQWWMPPAVASLPPHLRAHTGDAIDFASLAGRRVAVLGAGASAFDNAAAAPNCSGCSPTRQFPIPASCAIFASSTTPRAGASCTIYCRFAKPCRRRPGTVAPAIETFTCTPAARGTN